MQNKLCKCSVCGNTMDTWDMLNNIYIKRKAGYGSEFDTSYVDIKFCTTCFDNLVKSCVISPIINEDGYLEIGGEDIEKVRFSNQNADQC